MSGDTNAVILVGRLTRDPELKATQGGTSVCHLGLAVNERVKQNEQWTERPNYFDIDVFGGQGESCAQYLTKGRQVAVSGRLRWRSWNAQDGQKRSAVSVVADTVQFIGAKPDAFEQAKAMTGGDIGFASGPGDDEDLPF